MSVKVKVMKGDMEDSDGNVISFDLLVSNYEEQDNDDDNTEGNGG